MLLTLFVICPRIRGASSCSIRNLFKKYYYQMGLWYFLVHSSS